MAEEYVKKEGFKFGMFDELDNITSSEANKEIKQAFLAGLKADRPQWHDLKKDPNDLPKENGRYLCLIECTVGGAGIHECSDYDIQYNSWKDSYGDVIKWCEIPTFDKE